MQLNSHTHVQLHIIQVVVCLLTNVDRVSVRNVLQWLVVCDGWALHCSHRFDGRLMCDTITSTALVLMVSAVMHAIEERIRHEFSGCRSVTRICVHASLDQRVQHWIARLVFHRTVKWQRYSEMNNNKHLKVSYLWIARWILFTASTSSSSSLIRAILNTRW